MGKQKQNVVTTIYNREHAPYVYGAFHIVRSGSWKTTKPFVVSRRTATGEALVYGSILEMLLKVLLQIEKLREFSIRADAILTQKGLPGKDEPLPVGIPVADHIMDDQEDLIEEVLLVTSVRVRILHEIFEERIEQYTVPIYDYGGVAIGSAQIHHIGNLIAHNRYVCVQDEYVVDLYSDERTLGDKGQLGLKMNFLEYVAEIEKAVRGLTVKDLLKYLRAGLENLSADSDIKDMVNLHQNLYTIGGLVGLQPGSGVPGPLKTILDKAAVKHLERKHSYGPPKGENRRTVQMKCTIPRFSWDPDLEEKRIRVSLFVNDDPEVLIMELGEFFQDMEAAYGDDTLLAAAGFPTRG